MAYSQPMAYLQSMAEAFAPLAGTVLRDRVPIGGTRPIGNARPEPTVAGGFRRAGHDGSPVSPAAEEGMRDMTPRMTQRSTAVVEQELKWPTRAQARRPFVRRRRRGYMGMVHSPRPSRQKRRRRGGERGALPAHVHHRTGATRWGRSIETVGGSSFMMKLRIRYLVEETVLVYDCLPRGRASFLPGGANSSPFRYLTEAPVIRNSQLNP